MPLGSRKLLLVIGCMSLAVTVAALGLMLYVQRAGTVVVQVHDENGDDVHIRVPAILAQLLIDFTPRRCFHCDMRGTGDQIRPVMHQLCSSLREAPDFTMLEARSGSQNVQISKVGREIQVEVLSPGERVHVSMPFPLLSRLMERI